MSDKRENFVQILENGESNPREDYDRLYMMYKIDLHLIEGKFLTIWDLLQKNFDCISFQGKYSTLDEFNKAYHFEYNDIYGPIDLKTAISFAEYLYNMLHALYDANQQDRNLQIELGILLNRIEAMMSDASYQLSQINELYIFEPISDPVPLLGRIYMKATAIMQAAAFIPQVTCFINANRKWLQGRRQEKATKKVEDCVSHE